MKTKLLFELHKIDTGYLLVRPEGKDCDEKIVAFHNDIVRDEREKLLNEIVKLLCLKHDFEVRSRRVGA